MDALIFDFDGLILDTEISELQSWREIYAEHSADLPIELWALCIGSGADAFDPFAYLESQIGYSVDRKDILARRHIRHMELLASEMLLPGIEAYLHDAKRLGLKIGLASSSPRRWVAGHLSRLGIIDAFDFMKCGDEVTHKKPDPELYLGVLSGLGVRAENAIALEDSPNGVLAAQRAGIFCVAIPNPVTSQLDLAHADLRLQSLALMPLEDLIAEVEKRKEHMAQTHPWWQTGVIYQIYPRSFMDSNDDGVGDLAGITHKLDYLKWLGIDTLWLSPIYPSPMADFGYDIANYTDIDPLFGTLADFDVLLQQAHSRNLKVILDYVPNHTSDEHPWFQQSRTNRTNEKRNWYIWRDPAPDGGPPNNWLALFGGPAWQFDEQTGQYYLHLFDVKQPDLNWRNPAVRTTMYDVLRFWLERGVDGFRVDVLWMMIKDEQFRNNIMNPDWQPGDPPYTRQFATYTEDQPGMHDVVREMRTVIDTYGERVFIGELYLPLTRLVHYYGKQLDEAHMPFNFQLVSMPDWNAPAIRKIVDEYEQLLPAGAWPNWVLGNHDRPRIATRTDREQSRVAHMMLLTLRGTPTCYYGDELGMEDSFVPLEMIHDPQGKDNPEHSRDPIRTPMQWDSSAHAGFSPSDVTPWLPVAKDYQVYNVAGEQSDAHSFLTLVHRLLELRRASPALTLGSYTSIDQENADCFVYQRAQDGQRYLVALNISAQKQVVKMPEAGLGRVMLSTHLNREGSIELSEFQLRANEGYLIEIISA